ncbi:MAG: M56 family metallopeptidase [Tahibacter sp.]
MTSASMTGFLLTVILHGGSLMLLVWLLERTGLLRLVAAREWAWRTALLGGLLSAGLQILLVPIPVLGNISILSVSEPAGASSLATESPAVSTAVAAPAKAESERRAEAPPSSPRSGKAAKADRTSPVNTPVHSTWLQRILHLAWSQWLLAAWFAASLLLLAGWLRGAFSLRDLLRRAVPLTDVDILQEWNALCIGMQVEQAQIAQLDEIASPIALPGCKVLVPGWLLRLPARQRRAALAHELAHLRRGDPYWRAALLLWRSVFCIVPLSGFALRRLDSLAELQCDAHAAQFTGDGRALAECLALCIERRSDFCRSDLAVAMATPNSPLVQRAELLLEGTPMSLSQPSFLSRCAPVFALAVSVVLLPSLSPRVVAAVNEPTAKTEQIVVIDETAKTEKIRKSKSTGEVSIHIDSDAFDDHMRVRLRDDVRSLDVDSKGKLGFNADESDIASLSERGTASVEETRGGVTRRIEYSVAAGKLQRRYLKNGNEQTLDAEAQQWIAAIIPALLRETGIDAEARVERFFARGGSAAVFAEIAQITSDHTRAAYIGFLVGKHELNQEDLGRLLTLVDGIDSDYELRNVLANMFTTQKLDTQRLLTLLQVAAHIDSDYESAELLVATAHRSAADPALRAAWLANAKAVDSDYERRRALQSMVEETADPQMLSDILDATDSIESDYEKREVLSAIAVQSKDADAIAPSYAKATQRIGSDYERRIALMSLLNAGKLGHAGAMAVLDAAAGIESDYECRELLVAIARRMPNDAQVRARYLEVAAKLSDYEREQAQSAIGAVNG